MKFNTKLICSVLASLLLFASGHALAASASDGGGDALIELLSIKGIITPEEVAKLREKSISSAGSGLEGVVELLRIKGTISRDEADNLLKRFTDTSKKASQEKGPDETTVLGKSGEPKAEPIAKLPEKEIKPVLDVLREQGVLGSDEAEQIKERIGKKWSASDDDDFIAMEDQEIEYNRSTLSKEGLLANIVKLQHQGLITGEESERIRSRFLHKLSLERVTDSIGENVQRDMRAEIAGKIMPIPEWTQRIKLKGDLRLRYRADLYDKNNAQILNPAVLQISPPTASSFINSSVDRYYAQVRARLGLTARVTDQVEMGISLATGNTTNPVSTNATLGESLNKKSFVMDQAYLKWTPFRDLSVWGGRFENPWFCTDLVWDPDINFDGLAISWKPELGGMKHFFTAGAFPIEELEANNRDKWLFGGQIGVNYKFNDNLTASLAAAYYQFVNITGRSLKPTDPPGSTDWSKPKFQQKGNTPMYLDPNYTGASGTSSFTGLAARFKELNITTKIDYSLYDNYKVTLIGDYVNNLGYNSNTVEAHVGQAIRKETEGYQVGVSVGKAEIRDFMDWRMLLNYKYLEADAVVDGFTESDFHLGGTNAKGWITGFDLGLARNVWLTTRWLTANEISGLPLAIDVFYLNLNAKF